MNLWKIYLTINILEKIVNKTKIVSNDKLYISSWKIEVKTSFIFFSSIQMYYIATQEMFMALEKTMSESIGMMDKAYFVGKVEILNWFN